ncbi:hypothetical protein SAMN05443144_106156 [Fodinibius roseus]|uniref:Uncharacterized protein n=1 Tax=Fodinibius roseus TaxID=1194090 RepID=A0A1M4ZWF2_9BACT|nr:hypothetical protein SAMN05443144_106156 [Fodinibius roseus]
MYHVRGEYLRQYFDAVRDIVDYIMYPHTNDKQALASLLSYRIL